MENMLNPASSAKLLFDSGILFAINREILHPLGLAMAVTFEDGETEFKNPTGVVVIDGREDPEGFRYNRSTLLDGAVKYDNYMQSQGEKSILFRKDILGYVIQPIDFPSGKSFEEDPKKITPAAEEVPVFLDAAQKDEIAKEASAKAPSGRGAAVRKDLVSETESFSSIIKNSGLSGGGSDETLPEAEPRPVRKVDITKMKIVNKTKYTDACEHPQENIVNESLGAGGRVVFCSACGAQFSDTDLQD